MAARVRLLITDLPKDHQFDIGAVDVSPEGVERYLAAVEDTNNIYAEHRLAPPLAGAALALAQRLNVSERPGGTLHTGQEIEMRGGVPIGASLSMRGRIAQRSQRAGIVIIVVEFALTAIDSSVPSLTGRTTVMVAGAAA